MIEVRPIFATDTLPLRSTVLRPGRPIETAIFQGDESPETRHFGAFRDGELLGVASLYQSTLPPVVEGGQGRSAWQLRGMAVDPSFQKSGIGQALVQACMAFVGETPLWCNARSSAAPFYRANGFITQGDEFVIPDVGPHFVMVLKN